jgi:hypothetical protein
MRGGEIALLDAGHGHIRVEVAGETLEAATRLAGALRVALATKKSAPERVSIAFWMRGEWGGDVRHREIDAEPFAEIAGNYSAPVRAALEQLIARRAPERGRLILWRGEPGTGKSHALRALVRAWAPWCSAHFIMDPEELLGHGGAYMLDVLTWDGAREDRWRLLILEDAGELITADARASTGRRRSQSCSAALATARSKLTWGLVRSGSPERSKSRDASYQFVSDAVMMCRRSSSVTAFGATASRRCCFSAPSTSAGMSSSV